MRSTAIQAKDSITIQLPVAKVWSVLTNVAEYPQWWPWYLGIRVISAVDQQAPGTEVAVCPLGKRVFWFRVEKISGMESILLRYPGSFITGYGEWQLQSAADATIVSFQLDVQAHGWAIVLLGTLFNLGWMHSLSMRHLLRKLRSESIRQASI